MRLRSILIALLLIPVSVSADFLQVGQFPAYLFADWRYWTFIALYTLLTLKVVLWTLQAAPGSKDKWATFPMQDVSKAASIIFGVAILYQIAHHFEHITQIFQWWYMGLPPTQAKGIIFFADLEWNHFTFDMGYFILLCIASLVFVRRWWLAGHRVGKMGTVLLLGMNVVQGWHAVEHTYRIVNHIQTGCEPCAGIVDQLTGVPLIPLHFWYNVLALTLPLMCFYWFGMHKRVGMMFSRKKAMAMEKGMAAMKPSMA